MTPTKKDLSQEQTMLPSTATRLTSKSPPTIPRPGVVKTLHASKQRRRRPRQTNSDVHAGIHFVNLSGIDKQIIKLSATVVPTINKFISTANVQTTLTKAYDQQYMPITMYVNAFPVVKHTNEGEFAFIQTPQTAGAAYDVVCTYIDRDYQHNHITALVNQLKAYEALHPGTVGYHMIVSPTPCTHFIDTSLSHNTPMNFCTGLVYATLNAQTRCINAIRRMNGTTTQVSLDLVARIVHKNWFKDTYNMSENIKTHGPYVASVLAKDIQL